ncbi:MAG: two-component regulator propeller domain-containing protein [Candidatus Acidiferrum sp.]
MSSINSNTFRERKTGRRWFYEWILTVLVVVCFVNTADALDANEAISQYLRDQWGAEEGFPGGTVYAIAQTPDGYLWIGTENGLVRFDGVNFVLFRNAATFPAGPVLGLAVDSEGNLWIRQEGPKLLRYHDGVFRDVLTSLEQREASVTAMSRGENGQILFTTLVNGTFRYHAGTFVPLASVAELPKLIISLAETADGTIWLGSKDSGLFYLSASRVYGTANGSIDRKINAILPAANHELWIGTDDGVVRWNGSEFSRPDVSRTLDHVQVLVMVRDRESNIWVGTSTGLSRLNARGVSSLEQSDRWITGPVTALLEDRDGNLWVGTTQGIGRLRNSMFTTYFGAGALPSQNNGPIFADSDNRTWYAPLDGGLYWLKEGRVGRVTNAGLLQDVVYSISGGKRELWIGRQKGGLTHLRYEGSSFTGETYTHVDGLAQNSVYAVHQNRDGTVWAGTLSAGVSNFRSGKFTTYTTADGLASNTIASITEASDGTMWFGTPNGLNAFSKGKWRTYTSEDGLPPGTVNCLLQDSAGVLWIGTENGLAFNTSDSFQIPREVPESLHEQIFGIEEDKTGSLWIATSNHVLRVDREKLLSLTVTDADVREYGPADGLRGVEGVKRYESVVKDSLGRIWFSTNRGISFISPTSMMESAPALVHVEGISADGRQFNLGDVVRIPAPHQRIVLSYSGLSLSVPGRVRFKYKLDGFDPDWSEPTAAREASYTNLASGSYRFHVVASNSDGIWNGSESTLLFEIDPVFWQSWWFRLSSILIVALAILMFFRLRVLGLTKQMNMRFEERLAERTRIAQELHDTLLQGFLSASMQLHVANDILPVDSPAKPFVGRILELMGRVIDEGRNAVRGLRLPKSEDLEQAFSRIPQEIAVGEGTDYRVFAEGEARPLRPAVREEIYRIGREAVVNALRHSRGSKVEVELEYSPGYLRLLVRDNGTGIDPEVVGAGREGHWGLSGMRERADRIGARLRVLSGASVGTEIELSVPDHIVFEFPPSDARWGWLSKLKLRMLWGNQPKAESERQNERASAHSHSQRR